jgi:hypothetical protein
MRSTPPVAVLGLLAVGLAQMPSSARVDALEEGFRRKKRRRSRSTVPGTVLPSQRHEPRAHRRDPVTGLKLRVE